MITITINCNSDCVVIENEANKSVITIPISGSMSQIETLLTSIFNTHDTDFEDRTKSGTPIYSIGVRLDRIDEDTCKTIEEW